MLSLRPFSGFMEEEYTDLKKNISSNYTVPALIGRKTKQKPSGTL